MSVIARSSNGKIMLFCKGADSVIYQRLTSSANGYKEATQKHMDEWAQCGLRTLCIAEREIEAQEYDSWNKKFIEASQALEQRTELLEDVA